MLRYFYVRTWRHAVAAATATAGGSVTSHYYTCQWLRYHGDDFACLGWQITYLHTHSSTQFFTFFRSLHNGRLAPVMKWPLLGSPLFLGHFITGALKNGRLEKIITGALKKFNFLLFLGQFITGAWRPLWSDHGAFFRSFFRSLYNGRLEKQAPWKNHNGR